MQDLKFKQFQQIYFKEDGREISLQYKKPKNDSTAATKSRTQPSIPLNLLGCPKNCILCQKSITSKKMPTLIHGALYRKYSGDLDSFYSRDIKYILRQRKSRSFIWFVDSCIYDECEEY